MAKFVKGQSGNPGGKKPRTPEEKAKLQGYANKALAVIVELMESCEEPAIRLKAATYLYDQGFGKAVESVHVSGAEGGPLVAVIKDG